MPLPLLSSFRRPRRSSSRSSHSSGSSHTSHASRHEEAHQKRRYTQYSIINMLLLFITFILLLLVSLSLPITKSIYLLSMNAEIEPPDLGFGIELPQTSLATQLRFGVWGFCAFSTLGLPGISASDGRCTTPALGYDVDPSILALTGYPDLIEAVLHGLTLILVLHPICAVLAFIALSLSITSLLMLLFSSSHHTHAHGLAICSLVVASIKTVLNTLSAIIDIVIVAVARDKVGELTDFTFVVGWGNAVWMSLAAAILSWISVVLLSAAVCGCCGLRWRPGGYRRHRHAKMEEAQVPTIQENIQEKKVPVAD